MNIRKPADYSVLFSELDKLIAAQLPQMELYCEIGRVVSGRAEKGAAVLPATCAVCGRFTRPMKNPLKSHGWR